MSTSALVTRGLSKSFGSLAVSRDIALELPVGGRYALIGPNGAGKTTLINLLSGDLEQGNKKLTLETGGFFEKANDVKNAVVGVANNKPVYLGDVADVTDGFEETGAGF